MSDDNHTAQLEEIETLKSIYFEDEYQVFKNAKNLFELQIYVSIEVPDGYQARYITNLEDLTPSFLPLKHLPPILLRALLPTDYPSNRSPSLKLLCDWLLYSDIIILTKKLNELWNSSQSPIIYTWIEFLKTDTLSVLNMTSELDLVVQSEQYLNFVAKMNKENAVTDPEQKNDDSGIFSQTLPDKLNCSSPDCGNSRQFKSGSTERNEEKKIRDHKTTKQSVVLLLENYNKEHEKTVFSKTYHPCEICFTDKLGRDMILFSKCGHIFCRECLNNYFTVLINEGLVSMIKCPGYKCDTEATQAQVQELVSEELFEKYDRTLLNTMLDTMSDIVYCPRTQCQYPVSIKPAENLAVCPNCNYAFCILCKMVYHGVEPCRLQADERRKLVELYQNAAPHEQSQLEKKYGRKQLQSLLNSTLTDHWIQEFSKKCPHCNVIIEKSEGCNKMSCWKCNTCFCWLCGAQLDSLKPYLHYNNPKSPCLNKLFFLVDVEDDEDWGWEEIDEDSGTSDLEAEDS